MFVEIIDETAAVSKEHQELVEAMIVFAADYLQYPKNRECCVSFVSPERIQEINRDFRNKDAVTDVISFALNDDDEDIVSTLLLEKEDEHFVSSLGDIIICTDRAAQQAEEYAHSFERELGFLALHGFLHLNGYDHQTSEEEAEMFGLQQEILDAYGLSRK